MLSPGPTRRALLTAGALALAAGCTDSGAARSTASPDPDLAPRRRAAAATAGLIAAYDAALAARPALAPRLRPLRAQLLQHHAALTTPAATPTRTAPPTTPPTLTGLASLERRTAATHTAALAIASPDLARLLASTAAANATHAVLLTRP